MAESSVCYVAGDTTENPSIHPSDARHLENAFGQKSVSGQAGQRSESLSHGENSQIPITTPDPNPWINGSYRCHILPAVSGVQRHSVPLPADVGLWNSVDLALEASDAALVHTHGCWVGVELGKS